MDFVSNIANKAQADSDHSNNLKTATNDPDLFSSAKVVASAAQSQFRSEQYDRQKAAGAGADLLDAASDYGKLDSTQGVGKYVDQAEGYLRQYNTNSTGTEITESQESAPAGDLKTAAVNDESGGPKSTFTAEDDVKDDTTTDNSVADGGDSAGEVIKSAIPTGVADKERGGGVEEFEKKAEEFLRKESGDGGEDEKNGDYNSLEEYEKKAEGFLSKESGDGDEEEKTEDYNSLKEDVDDTLKKMPPGKDAGDYAKEAEGVIGKASDGGEKVEAASETHSSGGGGGFGNVMKMAGGFLNK